MEYFERCAERDYEELILLSNEIAPTPALVGDGVDALPAAILAHGERVSRRFIEFFTATIRNRNTRMAHAWAVKQFFDWCKDHRSLDDIEPIAIAAYIEQLGTGAAKPTIKQTLVAIRQPFGYLVTGGILPLNPAGSVRGPKYVVTPPVLKCKLTLQFSPVSAGSKSSTVTIFDNAGNANQVIPLTGKGE